jgi:hypothetical protein
MGPRILQFTDGQFRLNGLLDAAQSFSPPFGIYDTSVIPEIQIERLRYFAAKVAPNLSKSARIGVNPMCFESSSANEGDLTCENW